MMATYRKPEPLKAIYVVHGSHDLYGIDIHYPDGILHFDEYILSVGTEIDSKVIIIIKPVVLISLFLQFTKMLYHRVSSTFSIPTTPTTDYKLYLGVIYT